MMTKHLYYFRPSPLAGVLEGFRDSYRVLPIDGNAEARRVTFEQPAVVVAEAHRDHIAQIEKLAPQGDAWRLIYLLDGETAPWPALSNRVFAFLPDRVPRAMLERVVERAFESLRAVEEQKRVGRELDRAASDLETLNSIGMALSTERNLDALLKLILSKSREITCCDAGSLYLVEEDPDAGRHLVFELTQSDSHTTSFERHILAIDRQSVAGYAAATGTVLNIPDAYRIRNLPFQLNREFDRRSGYRTKSMLVVPMQNQKNEVIGVLQLINAKQHIGARLLSGEAVEREVIPFSGRSQQLAASLASQAAVAVENSLLYRDIQRLFEGFVKASVTAIESRDPTTFGHSERVSKLTLALADTVDRCAGGPYGGVHFTPKDLQELRYASLLHDFGKVGVREHVLVKAKKLYPHQLEIIHSRFLSARQFVELACAKKKLKLALSNGRHDLHLALVRMQAECDKEIERLDECLRFIVEVNEPGLTPPGAPEKLAEIAARLFPDPAGDLGPLLSAEEMRLLSIPFGTLDDEERAQIQSHVVHSFRFLSQIPWTRELKNIPAIAKAHHEKLDGSGYPYHLKGEEIPLQTRMITITDIYDALTASDRPYKRAVPVERALSIIEQEVKSHLLDPALFGLFVDAKVYQLTARAAAA